MRYKLGHTDGMVGTGGWKNHIRLGSEAKAQADPGTSSSGSNNDQSGPGSPVSVSPVSSSEARLSIDDVISSNDVVVFSSAGCPYCAQAIQALQDAGIEHVEVFRSAQMANELLTKTGKSSVPSVWVKGSYIGGCNDGPQSWMGVVPCIKSGKMMELLKD